MAKRKADRPPTRLLVTIDPHPIRRGFTTGVVGMLGMLLVYLAATHPPCRSRLAGVSRGAGRGVGLPRVEGLDGDGGHAGN